jgi:hypothetical protein
MTHNIPPVSTVSELLEIGVPRLAILRCFSVTVRLERGGREPGAPHSCGSEARGLFVLGRGELAGPPKRLWARRGPQPILGATPIAGPEVNK